MSLNTLLLISGIANVVLAVGAGIVGFWILKRLQSIALIVPAYALGGKNVIKSMPFDTAKNLASKMGFASVFVSYNVL